MVHERERIERLHQLMLQGQHQLDRLEPRILDPALRKDYLDAARRCLDQARDLMETLDNETTATGQRQALLAAETIVAVSNRQIRLLLVKLLDTYGPGALSVSTTGFSNS